MRALVRLPAQEGRNVELVFLASVMHRRLPSVLVETLRRRTLGVFGYRFLTRFCGLPHLLPRLDGRRVRGVLAAARRAGRGMLGAPADSEPAPLLLLLAPAQADRGQALQQRRPPFFRVLLRGSSPRRARISFCAGTGSSSIRGMRIPRVGIRSGCGGMNASGSCGSGPLRSPADR